jgi:hypothetical protein
VVEPFLGKEGVVSSTDEINSSEIESCVEERLQYDSNEA